MWVSQFRCRCVRIGLVLMMCIILICHVSLPAYAHIQNESTRQNHSEHLVLVLVPDFSFQDVKDMTSALPTDISQNLHWGAMTMRTASGINSDHHLISLSTGQHQRTVSGWRGYNREEEVKDIEAHALYRQRSGIQTTASIIHPDIFKLHAEWESETDTYPGWLGETLMAHQVSTYALGNSDVRDHKQRWAATFIMNKDGEAEGMIDERVLHKASDFPTGVQTDLDQIKQSIHHQWRSHERTFTVVELGDLKRLLSEKAHMSAEYFERSKTEWWRDFARWIEEVMHPDPSSHSSSEVAIWVLSSNVSKQAHDDGEDLAPFYMWTNQQTGGLMETKTTRQEGIVSNLDLVPTILSYFDIESPTHLPGHVIEVSSSLENKTPQMSQAMLAQWQNDIQYLFTIYNERRPIITTYIILILVLLFLATLYWGFTKQKEKHHWILVMIGSILLSPFFFLILTPLVVQLGGITWIWFLFLCSVLLSYLLYKWCPPILFVSLIGWLNALAILIDVWRGSPWMQRSFLGFDPIIGARYYGIGNEYAGILLGASIIAVVSLYVWLYKHTRWRSLKWVYFSGAAVFYAFIVLTLGSPQLGTNAGATLASVVTYIVSLWLMVQLQVGKKGGLLLFTLGLLATIAIFALHWRGEHTHIGAVLHLLADGDLAPVQEILTRKLTLNLKLVRVSLWGKLFVASLAVCLLMMFRWRAEQWQHLKHNPWFNGLRSIVLGAALLLILNDSGIVAAATAMIYGTFPFLSLKVADTPSDEIKKNER
ncbi:hypothetical protein [Caldalkalibacillus salinus]|uniref:hypothetical protein n=1 Tax=Caldalkalibacillus salinus TaxID=2803787 RepID=UPI0019234B1D|nr:hypothetical protein [Caldalkalibacillus salinus]